MRKGCDVVAELDLEEFATMTSHPRGRMKRWTWKLLSGSFVHGVYSTRSHSAERCLNSDLTQKLVSPLRYHQLVDCMLRLDTYVIHGTFPALQACFSL